ncbi:MAG: hypothetical protein ACO4CW_12890 [Planctomycetota bacterium]
MSIELPADCPGVALIAAADARLRQAAFDRLAAAGWRVDAVGDQRAVDRRLDIARKTLEEARFRYAHGQTDYLPVLTTLAALQNLEQERLARLRAALTVRVGLLRALAGAPGDA